MQKIKHTTQRTTYLLTILMVAMLSFATKQTAQAQDPGCDPEYLQSLQARAWMEAQREITQNQNLIFKPDSVLEYSCFDLYLNELADHAKDMFSETQRWGEVPGIKTQGDGSTDDALQKLTGEALKTYIEQNFEDEGQNGQPYDLLGGRLNEEEIDHDPEEVTGESRNTYNCDVMRRVWEQAKCMNFIDDEDHDGFYTFDQYQREAEKGGDDADFRFLPKTCPALRAVDPTGGARTRWEQEIKNATVNSDDGDDQPNQGTPWQEDIVETYYDKLEPRNCASADAIPTGFKVYRNHKEEKDWKVCLGGCHYDVDAETCQ